MSFLTYHTIYNIENNIFSILMKLVERHIISRTHPRWKSCDELCFLSKNLYNYALYKQIQRLETEGKIYSYNELEKILRVD